MLLDTSGLLCYHHRDERQHANAVTFFKTAPVRLTHNYPYSDTYRTCSSITKVYGCVKNHFPLSSATEKPRFYVCTFGQHTKVTL